MAKLTDLIKNKGKISYSFEVTPNVPEEEIAQLESDPVFFSVTWHAKSHQCKDLNIDPLRMANLLTSKQKHVLMNISCTMMKTNYLKQLLSSFQEKSICNLFLVLGEGFDPKTSDFENTSQLVKYIREQTGNYFCIGVAGFVDCSDEKLLQLKEKLDNGADFVITQAFFDVNSFKSFKERCEKNNIHAPILPGVYPYESFKELSGFMNMCKINVSDGLLEVVKTKEELNEPCLDVVKQLIQQVAAECDTSHFHFFTLKKLDKVDKFVQTL